ncbi:DUF58 domain-containing protein [Paludisphaera rhizosphaerae]|uniref:DUF58 domain-containing protein n=1 Tax=Paludisphaera rhizosphaerae TaxID=2711216 RepID=UPI0013E9A981|nr:DUF58 domain-containing protein [Paludisphaera rhizosphaerae]
MESRIESHDVLDSRQFLIAVKRLADSLSYGADRSPFLGSGVDYVQSRPYQYGDPIKLIDWRVTARTRRVHVKEYEAPKRMPAYLLIDTSASMTVGSHHPTKYETALFIAGGLALACLERISPVGVLGVGGRNLHVTPTMSKDQVMQWLHKLRSYRRDEPTSLGSRLAELTPSLTHRVLVIVLSDLHDPKAVPSLRRLAQQHDLAVLQLRDPAEESLRGVGFVRGREAETGAPVLVRRRARWLDQQAVEEGFKKRGIDHLLIDVDKPYVSRLRQFFRMRDLLGRGAR